ncbi:MAG: ECF transporter S component [Clostridia bacterium]|nr:ECF transporter S component [Clostridia bacterium]
MKKTGTINTTLINIILAAMFLSIGMVLPFFTAQIKEIGDTLLPMHIPVMLCGMICGGKYGFATGLALPFLRSLSFTMPPMYPNAVWMAIELATYGLVVGLIYSKFSKGRKIWIYISLIISMIAGRIAWGISKAVLLGGAGKSFTFSAFIFGGFVDALPGILLQLLLIPPIIMIINRKKY